MLASWIESEHSDGISVFLVGSVCEIRDSAAPRVSLLESQSVRQDSPLYRISGAFPIQSDFCIYWICDGIINPGLGC